MNQQKLIAQLRAQARRKKTDEKIERIALSIAPVVKAAILTIAVLSLFELVDKF